MSSHELIGAYPEQAAERDRWILARRGARNLLDSTKPFGFLIEEERAESGQLVSVATIFLTNRECPWRCLMCDLWKYALTETVPVGAIPAQIDFALVELSKQCSARFQPASSGDIPAERFNRQQEGSSELRRAIPIWKTSMKGDPPSPLTPLPSDGRGECPGEGEASHLRDCLRPLRRSLVRQRQVPTAREQNWNWRWVWRRRIRKCWKS